MFACFLFIPPQKSTAWPVPPLLTLNICFSLLVLSFFFKAMVFRTTPRRKERKSENCSFAVEARVIPQAEKAGTLASTAGSLLSRRHAPSRERTQQLVGSWSLTGKWSHHGPGIRCGRICRLPSTKPKLFVHLLNKYS